MTPSTNDPWLATWLECQRIATRLLWRMRILLLQFQLAKAERKLGELGWQQADFGPEHGNARELNLVERQQAHLLFESGELKEQITAATVAAKEMSTAIQRKIRVAEEVIGTIEARAAQLLESIAMEKKLESPGFILEPLQDSLTSEEKSLRQLRQTIHSLQEELAAHQQDSEEKISRLQLSLRQLAMEQAPLAHKKLAQFHNIGRELADAEIGPLNQPEILTLVLAKRKKLARLQKHLFESLEITVTLPVLLKVTARCFFALLLFTSLLSIFLVIAISLTFHR